MSHPRGITWCVLALMVGALGESAMAFSLASDVFQTGEQIPGEYTCDGANVSPALRWRDAPANAKGFALIADDPDAPAGTWVHWVLYDIPGTTNALPRAVPAKETLAGGGMHGVNDFHQIGYGGPCPPPGKPHRYVFRIYALDGMIHLPPRAAKPEVLRAISGHVLAEAELIGTYHR